jgi:uncharacterized repeat protein (TIGR01451 family)
VTYTISIPNTGTAHSSGTTLADPIPAGTTYVPGSTTLNGVAVADVGGTMPFATARAVNSPTGSAGQIKIGETATVSFRVTINPNPPLIITNVATIDPDGTGPAPAITVPLTNPPVRADLAVAISDNQATAVAGTSITYTATVTNNGPDGVISLNLAVALPATILNPVWTPSSGKLQQFDRGVDGLEPRFGRKCHPNPYRDGVTGRHGYPDGFGHRVTRPGVEDANTANNNASDTDTLTYRADLGITKTDGKTSVTPARRPPIPSPLRTAVPVASRALSLWIPCLRPF